MSTHSVRDFIRSATGRLTLTYLGIIMLMSISFSFIFYYTSSSQLDRQIPPDAVFNTYGGGASISTSGPVTDERGAVRVYIKQQVDSGRDALRWRLIGVNILALAAGSVISYGLARRNLQPIEEAMDAQNQFISDASHELKTPLTAIKSSNEVALRRKTLNLKDAKALISQNTEDVTKLQTLTDNLLGLINNKSAEIKLEPVSMQSAVSEAMGRVVSLAQVKNITVDDQVPDTKLLADQAALSQALTILLDNAIKYSDANKTVTMTGVSDNKFGYIRVSDQGVGIRASDIPHVFTRFYRADRSRSKNQQEGYGLGLSIAEKLIYQQGGTITVDSQLGQGSTFSIKLPLALSKP